MYWLIPFYRCLIETPLNRQQALDHIQEVTVPQANPLLLQPSISNGGNLFVGEVQSQHFSIQRFLPYYRTSGNVVITGITKPETNQMLLTFKKPLISNITPAMLLVLLILSLYLTFFVTDVYKAVSFGCLGLLLLFQFLFALEVRRTKQFLLELLQARECSF